MKSIYKKKLQEKEDIKEEMFKIGHRLAWAVERRYTEKLNEDIELVADGLIIPFLFNSPSPLLKEVSRFFCRVGFVFYPTDREAYPTSEELLSIDNGIDIKLFRDLQRNKQLPAGICLAHIDAIDKLVTHVNEKLNNGLVHEIHGIVFEILSKYGTFESYLLREGGTFPRAMNQIDVIRMVMTECSEVIESLS